VPDAALDPVSDVPTERQHTRVAEVVVTTHRGEQWAQRVDSPRGSRHRPMTWTTMADKAHLVLDAALGPRAVDELVRDGSNLDSDASVRGLRRHLVVAGAV